MPTPPPKQRLQARGAPPHPAEAPGRPAHPQGMGCPREQCHGDRQQLWHRWPTLTLLQPSSKWDWGPSKLPAPFDARHVTGLG